MSLVNYNVLFLGEGVPGDTGDALVIMYGFDAKSPAEARRLAADANDKPGTYVAVPAAHWHPGEIVIRQLRLVEEAKPSG